jgi:hypothetical protein
MFLSTSAMLVVAIFLAMTVIPNTGQPHSGVHRYRSKQSVAHAEMLPTKMAEKMRETPKV